MLTIASPEQIARQRVSWIIAAVTLFVTADRRHLPHDINAGVKAALETYDAGGTAANAIYQGYDAARQQMKKRDELTAALMCFMKSQARI